MEGATAESLIKFQSTHPYRVWLLTGLWVIMCLRFQSTHPYRVWHVFVFTTWERTGFNPHTHTGCDVRHTETTVLNTCFNPHTHTGCDSATRDAIPNAVFQSTHPYRVWHDTVGCILVGQRVSIHTPIQGVTPLSTKIYDKTLVSIHTPIQGVTTSILLCTTVFLVSIHTPIQGVTMIVRDFEGNIVFQSTHPYRVWL